MNANRFLCASAALAVLLAGCSSSSTPSATPSSDQPSAAVSVPEQIPPSAAPEAPKPDGDKVDPATLLHPDWKPGFQQIKTGLTQAEVQPPEVADRPVGENMAIQIRDKWRETGEAAAKAYSKKVGRSHSQSGTIFRPNRDSIEGYQLAGYTSIHGDAKPGDVIVIYFACLATEKGVTLPVYVHPVEAADGYVGGDFVCGHNELAEGTFEYKLSAETGTKLQIVNGGASYEGYFVISDSRKH